MSKRFNSRALARLAAVFAFGAVCYSLLEILWRGFTHWSMALTGGFCFAAIYQIQQKLSGAALWRKALLGCALITGAEFVVGCIVNLWLRWEVWDYSAHPLNLLGQICPLFSLVWFALCLFAFPLCALLQRSLRHPRRNALR